MVNKIIVVLALAAAVFAGWRFLSPSEESRVKETFAKMSAALDKDGTETNFDAIGKARRAVALVEPGCTFEAFDKKNPEPAPQPRKLPPKKYKRG